MTKKAASVFVQTLKNHGVDRFFCVPGESYLSVMDELLYSPGIDAEQLPFEDASFDRVTLAFGLRNMTHKDKALEELFRVLRPGGKGLILEFSKVLPPFEKLYDHYSFKVLPSIGRWVTGDAQSYRYLAESIRMHPGPQELAELMRQAGFGVVRYQQMSAGVVAIHQGVKTK